MSQELQTLSGLPPVNLDNLRKLVSSTGYLPYVQLVQAASPLAAPPHEISIGSLALRRNKSQIDDLGREVDAFMLTARPKAMRNDQKTRKIQSIHDESDPVFEEIKADAMAKVAGCYWGIEFLFLNADGEFFTFFCNNPTLRRAADETLLNFIGQPTTLKAVPLSDDTFNWWGLVAEPCSTLGDYPVPEDEIKETIIKFHQELAVSSNDGPIETEPTEDRVR